MSYEFIRYDVAADGIATVTLDRPERLNAMTRAMAKEIIAVMDEVDGDDRVLTVIFTGAGRAYCAGADLAPGGMTFDRGDADVFDMETQADFGGYVSRRILESTKPVIGAINGPAVGIGVTSTLPMDFRLASTTARFGFVFLKRGIIPEASSSWFLPRLVGIHQALEWVYTGRMVDADEALKTGLVRSIHEPDDLLSAARALALEITRNTPPVARAVARRMLWQMYGAGSPEVAHELDSRGIRYLGASADCAEGIAAFVEKREPIFTMKVSQDLPDYVTRWRQAGTAEAFLAEERARS